MMKSGTGTICIQQAPALWCSCRIPSTSASSSPAKESHMFILASAVSKVWGGKALRRVVEVIGQPHPVSKLACRSATLLLSVREGERREGICGCFKAERKTSSRSSTESEDAEREGREEEEGTERENKASIVVRLGDVEGLRVGVDAMGLELSKSRRGMWKSS